MNSNNSGKQSSTLFTRVVLLVLAGCVIWLIGSYAWQKWVPKPSIPIEARQAAHQKNIQYRLGQINGVPFSIPSHYLFFPVEYTDKSIWEPNKGRDYYKSKTFKDAIREFTVYVQWPTMEPRQPENEKSYLASRRESGPHDWFMVSVTSYIPKDRSTTSSSAVEIMAASQLDNYLARHVRGQLSKLSKPIRVGDEARQRLHPEIQYDLRDKDEVTGLKWAMPVGPGTEKSRLWNKTLYWDGDRNAKVTTYIKCPNGKFPNPETVGYCSHYFDLPELKSKVTVGFTPNWLSHWREIETKSRELILSLQITNPESFIKEN